MKLKIALLAGLLASTSANAYMIDTFIGKWDSPNSGDAAEQQALADILGIDTNDLTQIDKQDTPNTAGPFQNPGTTVEWYLDVDPLEADYFGLKFGTGGTSVSTDTYFFTNHYELNKIVWSNAQVDNLSGGGGCNNCNIGRLSHYAMWDEKSTPPPSGVPSPSSVLLFVLGVFGIASLRKKLKS